MVVGCAAAVVGEDDAAAAVSGTSETESFWSSHEGALAALSVVCGVRAGARRILRYCTRRVKYSFRLYYR